MERRCEEREGKRGEVGERGGEILETRTEVNGRELKKGVDPPKGNPPTFSPFPSPPLSFSHLPSPNSPPLPPPVSRFAGSKGVKQRKKKKEEEEEENEGDSAPDGDVCRDGVV